MTSSEGVSFEMEKVLHAMPDASSKDIKAGRILEINPKHELFNALDKIYKTNSEEVKDYASLLFDQALLIEGFTIEDPVEFSNKIASLIVKASH